MILYDHDKERLILASVISDASDYGSNSVMADEMLSVLEHDDFHSPLHSTVFDAILKCRNKNVPSDLGQMSTMIPDEAVFISSCCSVYSTTTKIDNLCQDIKILTRGRKVRQSAEATIHALDTGNDVSLAISNAEKMMFSATEEKTISDESGTIRDKRQSYMKEIEEEMVMDDAIIGVPSGLTALDNLVMGFRKTEHIILSARPSMGKSAFAVSMMVRQAKMGFKPVMFSLEMGMRELQNRYYSAYSAIDGGFSVAFQDLRTPKVRNAVDKNGNIVKDHNGDMIIKGLTVEKLNRLGGIMQDKSNANIYLDCSPYNTVSRICSIIRRMVASGNCDIAYIDHYLLLVKDESREREELNGIAKAFKRLAIECKIPIVGIHQLGREVEKQNRKPRMSDLSGSGAIEQSADIILFPYRESVIGGDKKPSEAELIIGKGRSVEGGCLDLHFDTVTASFMDKKGEDYDGKRF